MTTARTQALTVTKTTTTASYSTLGPGHPLHHHATNSGNVTLSAVDVTDANATITSCTRDRPVATLAVGASITCSATHTVTQADLDAANVTNVATGTYTPPRRHPPPRRTRRRW